MTKRSLILGAGLAASFLMLAGMECPGKNPLVPAGGGGGGVPALIWNLIGGGNRTVNSGDTFSIAHEIILTDGYAGDRSTYDFTVTGLPSTWEHGMSPTSITCPPEFNGARPGNVDPKSSSGCVAFLEGSVDSSTAPGDYPYSVRAQRRGTNESQTVIGTITVASPSANLSLNQFTIPDREMTNEPGYPYDDNLAEWEMEVVAPEGFNGIVDVSVAFADSRINNAPFRRQIEPGALDFGVEPSRPLSSEGDKRRRFRLSVERLDSVAYTGDFNFTVTLSIRGTSQTQSFSMTGDNALRIVPAQSGDLL